MMDDEVALRAAVLVVLATGLSISAWLRRRADRTGGVVKRSADGRVVAATLALAAGVFYGALLAWLVHPPLVEWSGVAVPTTGRWTGAALVAAGIGLAVWSLSHLGRNVTPTAVARADADLVTSGPYRLVRHPLYTSMLLTVPGCALASANLLVLTGGTVAFLVILLRIRREEAQLVRVFGDRYRKYMDRTGRLLPRLRRRR